MQFNIDEEKIVKATKYQIMKHSNKFNQFTEMKKKKILEKRGSAEHD